MRFVAIIVVLAVTYRIYATGVGGSRKPELKEWPDELQEDWSLRRHLLQNINESFEFVFNISGCNPQFQDCSGAAAVSLQNNSVSDPWTPVSVSVRDTNTTSTNTSVGCLDEPPPGASFDCAEYKSLRLCSAIPADFCQISCSTCVEECEDLFYPGTQDCCVVLEQNICENPAIKDKYCQKSCGQCPESTKERSVDDGKECGTTEDLECDVEALLAFKNTSIDLQDIFLDWEGSNACDWTGVVCGDNNRVYTIDLVSNILLLQIYQSTARLVPEMSKLRYLSSFGVTGMDFTGSLPVELSLLQELTYFSLRFTKNVQGTLPPQYSTWKSIDLFDVSMNQISGTIPVEYSAWNIITTLELHQNQLTGQIPPQLSSLTNLQRGKFENNNFIGTLPNAFSTWKKLELLAVGVNNINGTLPREYSEWRNLGEFLVSNNSLTGPLPKAYSRFIKITAFDVQDNELSGGLPVQYSRWADCTTFNVAENQLSGNLPVEYSRMRVMQKMDLFKNQFSGELPKQYSSMRRNIARISVYQNDNLSKQIPVEWSGFSEQVSLAQDTSTIDDEFFTNFMNVLEGILPALYP